MSFLVLFHLAVALNFEGSQVAVKDISHVDHPSVGLSVLDSAYQRFLMVKEQLEIRGIKDPRVLAAMISVQRHLFVPEAVQPRAYEDSPLPTELEQTISQPYIVARMSEAARVSSEDRVLEIGTGTGYQAAVLSMLAKEVYTIEILGPLAVSAQKRLERLGYNNVHVKIGDGNLGWPEQGPFDVILVTAQASEIPKSLLEQLKPNGRLIMPLGGRRRQKLLRIENLGDVRFVPLIKGSPEAMK